jgi:hypothetical protein
MVTDASIHETIKRCIMNIEKEFDEKISYLMILWFVLSRPKIAFELILKKDETFPQLIILGTYGFLSSIAPILLYENYDGIVIIKLVFRGLVGGAFGWLSIWFLSQLINLTNKIMKIETEFEYAYLLFSFSFIPMIITYLIILIANYFFHLDIAFLTLTPIITLTGYTWTIILIIIGNKLLSKANWIKSTISVIIPVTAFFVFSIFLLKLRANLN